MEKLPLETVQYVMALVSQHPPSLRAFACVSWGCYYAASVYLFHTLHFGVNNDGIDMVEQYSQQLEQAFAFQHVRCVKIVDRLEKKVPRNEFWISLSSLIKRFSGLSDLFFEGFLVGFPICLLDILHQHHPRCRLHIRQFRPHNPRYAWSHRIGYERLCQASDHELAMRLVADSEAPNLKEVSCSSGGVPALSPRTSSPAGRFQPNPERSRGSLESLSLSHDYILRTSTIEGWVSCTDFSVLQTLQLEQRCREKTPLRYIMADVNAQLPSLKTLLLGMTLKYESVPHTETNKSIKDFLKWVPRLRSLTLFGWSPLVREVPSDSFLAYHGSRLTDLCLAPYHGLQPTLSDLTLVVESFPLLRKLAISMRRTYGDAREVKSYRLLGSLPKLQHLSLDLDVSDLQRDVSNIQGLLGEDMWPEDSDDDEFSEGWIPFDMEALPNHESHREFDLAIYDVTRSNAPTNGRIRGALINAAIDKSLACSIFETISGGKPKVSVPLERLDLKAIEVGEFGNVMSDAVLGVFKTIAKEWRVEKNPRYDTNEPVAKETGEPVRFLTPAMTLPNPEKWPEYGVCFGLKMSQETGRKSGTAFHFQSEP
ncbi:unnamed protein product [Penicillium pancosmium]